MEHVMVQCGAGAAAGALELHAAHVLVADEAANSHQEMPAAG